MEVGSNQRWSTPSTITSWHHFHSIVTQNCQNLTQLQLCNNSVRVHLYAYVPHWKMLKQFIDVHYGCGNQSQMDYSLNHDIMASFPPDSHKGLPKIWPSFGSVTVWGCTHMPTYLIERWKNTLYMTTMDVGSNQRWTTASTMTYHSDSTIPPISQ